MILTEDSDDFEEDFGELLKYACTLEERVAAQKLKIKELEKQLSEKSCNCIICKCNEESSK